MRKQKGIVVLALLGCMALSLTGCFGKKPVTGDKFADVAESHDYETTEMTALYVDVESVWVAESSNGEAEILFIEFESEEDAKDMYEELVEEAEDDSTGTKTVSMKHYESFEGSTSTLWGCVKRVENTVLYTAIDKDQKKEVEKVIDDINY